MRSRRPFVVKNAVAEPAATLLRLEVSVDNVKATQTRPLQGRMEERDEGRFTGCVSTLYTRRSGTRPPC